MTTFETFYRVDLLKDKHWMHVATYYFNTSLSTRKSGSAQQRGSTYHFIKIENLIEFIIYLPT